MYGSTDLAKMYDTTKQTMTIKMQDSRLKPYLIQVGNGKKLSVDGLNTLNLIMADSKVVKIKSKVDESLNEQNDSKNDDKYIDKYISSLLQTIDNLTARIDSVESEKLELKEINKELTLKLINWQDRQLLLEEGKKKSWFNFRNNKKP
jgi:hypothetical protein